LVSSCAFRNLKGDIFTKMELGFADVGPSKTFVEVLCPDEAPSGDYTLDNRLYLFGAEQATALAQGGILAMRRRWAGADAELSADERVLTQQPPSLFDWDGGASAYMGAHTNRWMYSKDSWYASMVAEVMESEPEVGQAYFFTESMGGGFWFGELVLLPDSGDRAYMFSYTNKTRIKMRLVDEGDATSVMPPPKSIPLAVYCFDAASEPFPPEMDPAPTDAFYAPAP